MKQLSILCLALILFCPMLLKAEWQLGVKKYLYPNNRFNTKVFLHYKAESDRDKRFMAEVSFRPIGQQRIILSREVELRTRGSRLFTLDFSLADGAYDLDVTIRDTDPEADPERNLFNYLELPEPYLISTAKDVITSGIYLSYEPNRQIAFSSPVLEPVLKPEKGAIFYFLEIHAQGYDALSIQAELYESKAGADLQSSAFFVSISESREVIYTAGRKQNVFFDSLDLSRLTSGEYQIDIRIYQEDRRLAEEKLSFSIGSDLKEEIFKYFDQSCRQMVYIVSDSVLEALLQERDEWVRKKNFNEIWQELYQDEAEIQMVNYFQKISEANSLYLEPENDGSGRSLEGWQTDRGRIYIQYGKPKEKEIVIDGRTYLRWTYPRWSLSFLFEIQGQKYILVK